MNERELILYLFLLVSFGGPLYILAMGAWEVRQRDNLPEDVKLQMAREHLDRIIAEYESREESASTHKEGA